MTYDERLVERHCGDWEGLTIDEIAQRYPDEWAARGRSIRFITGRRRARTCPTCCCVSRRWQNGCSELPVRKLAIVSHGISGRVLLTHFLGLKPSEADRVRQPNDFVYRLTFSDGRVSCDHFRGGEGPHPGLFLHAPDQVG